MSRRGVDLDSLDNEMSGFESGHDSIKFGRSDGFASRLECGGKFSKYTTYLCIVLTVLMALGLVIFGGVEYDSGVNDVLTYYVFPDIALGPGGFSGGALAMGLVLWIVAAIGYFSIKWEKRWMIFVFVFFCFIFGLSILVVSLILLSGDGDHAMVVADSWANMPTDVQEGVQEEFECCGVGGVPKNCDEFNNVECGGDEGPVTKAVGTWLTLFGAWGFCCSGALIVAFVFSYCVSRALRKDQEMQSF